MPSQEEQELLARIGQLAGKINLHKAQQAGRSLINSAVYDKTNEAHVKAIEASRQQKIRQQDAREQQQLANHFQRYSGNASAPHTPTNPTATGNHEIEIQGIRFRVANSGSKLIKVSGDLHSVNATPKVAFVGGVKFHRSKTGNLYRDGVLKAQRVSSGALVCRSFGMYGYCDKGDECEERHVFECPDFSNTGKCKTRGCKLLHRERASVLRKRADGAEMEDLSSDDEPVDSDDVDSDEVEEFITDGAGDDTDFKVQKDFISF
ncbi:uncharacterized protein N0V96_002153 [Colletotrichum fioriniae]|uniref:uncharacterized protein n=1 Tax=Colletotrichum fioriniae TaxID=710243 RepID=UPI0032DAA2CA|nr:hypothetical protein N0V96_002153 [Colletotrichum fioriniae]